MVGNLQRASREARHLVEEDGYDACTACREGRTHSGLGLFHLQGLLAAHRKAHGGLVHAEVLEEIVRLAGFYLNLIDAAAIVRITKIKGDGFREVGIAIWSHHHATARGFERERAALCGRQTALVVREIAIERIVGVEVHCPEVHHITKSRAGRGEASQEGEEEKAFLATIAI